MNSLTMILQQTIRQSPGEIEADLHTIILARPFGILNICSFLLLLNLLLFIQSLQLILWFLQIYIKVSDALGVAHFFWITSTYGFKN